MELATTSGRRATEAETAGVKGAKAKARTNRRENKDTPRASTVTMAATITTTAAATTTTAATGEEASS